MELAAWTRGDRRQGPHVLLTGGVHGDEFEPMVALRQLIDELSTVELRGQVTIIPVVNEPAFGRGQRTADDGLDLARTCPGRAEGSVTERIAAALTAQIHTADYYVDLHTGGTSLQVYPLTGYVLHANSDILVSQRRMARVFGLPVVWGTDPTLPGRSLSVARDARVPAIYAEYLGGGGCSRAGVAAYVRGCRRLLVDLQVLAGEPLEPEEPSVVVEDSRPNSGYMQIQNPAPFDGYFTPQVGLGERVRVGQPLGDVSDVLGRQRALVASQQDGIVLVLRTFPRVSRGDSVGVVLETPHDPPQLPIART